MKSFDIVKQLKILLPKYTDYFHDVLDVTSMSVSAGYTTFTCSSAHGLTSGDAITISGYLFKNKITDVQAYDSNGTSGILFKTIEEHDQTKRYDEDKTVTLQGFTDSNFNGEQVLLLAGRDDFVIDYDNTTLPSLSGSEYLLEDRIDKGINGLWEITKIDNYSFKINTEVEGSLEDYWSFTGSVRVSTAYDILNAQDIYTQYGNNKFYAFVVMHDCVVSKDRRALSDATSEVTIASRLSLLVIDGFSVLVFCPTTDVLEPGYYIDICRHDLQIAIHKCLLNVNFESGFNYSGQLGTVATGSNVDLYDKAYMVYTYNYEMCYLLSSADAVEPDKSRAFRNMDYSSNDRIETNDIDLQDNLT